MSRDKRAMMAKQTVGICDAGYYEPPSGKRVTIADDLAKAKAGTVLYSLEKPPLARASGEFTFAVFDRSEDLATYQAFAERFH